MDKHKKLIIIGAGEFATIAHEYFTYDSTYEVVAFSVERDYVTSSHFYEKPLIALDEIISSYSPETHDVFVAIPASQLNRLRTRLYQTVKKLGYACATYISSQAFVWRNAQIGDFLLYF